LAIEKRIAKIARLTRISALGRRVSRDDGSQLTSFTYDGQDVLMDDDSVGGVSTYQNGLGIDNRLKVSNSTTSSYFLADHLGSTNGLADANGSVIASNSYDSFGNATNTIFSSRYRLTRRELDPVTGLQYNPARWYDPAIGRFISKDRIGFRGGKEC
jgi:RHS repeat-associated protein